MVLAICCLIFITILVPPIGVFFVAGCGADLCINILLTLLAWFPGVVHAIYIEKIYYERKKAIAAGQSLPPAGGVYSERVQRGGHLNAGPAAV